MPTFAPNCPFIPDRLVQELEDDRVVIFCGAGISIGAGLPTYTGLVSYCYSELGAPLPPKRSTDWLWPDRMLGALEGKFGSRVVRAQTVARLKREPADLDLHKAILRLAKLKNDNGLRLVTTNFDTFLERAQEGMQLGRDFHAGPILPIPRNDQIASWKSVVYLHGRLEEEGDNSHLVLTSADFGRAYLTEAWAARFVARLFSEFTVLFVGYSLNDAVLRYMTDAFAAEESLTRSGRRQGPAYIFVPFAGRTAPDPQVWKDRRLEPIFYNQMRHHVRLKKTLMAWAAAREDYLSNARVMIGRIAPRSPSSIDPSSTGNLTWAVMGRYTDLGHGASIFAKIEPPPPFEWMLEFEKRDQQAKQLYEDEKATRAAHGGEPPQEPSYVIEEMFPSATDGGWKQLSPAAFELVRWLARHLASIQFIEWMIEKMRRGRRPHPLIRLRIVEQLGKEALPAGFDRFWRIVTAEGDWSRATSVQAFRSPLRESFASQHDEGWFVQELRAALRPYLTFERSLVRTFNAEADLDGSRLSDVAHAKVELADDDDILSLMDEIKRSDPDGGYWSQHLDLLTTRIEEVLDLFWAAGDASETTDPSSYERPSIVPHPQNAHHARWTVLFDLLWQGWVALNLHDLEASRRYVERWLSSKYSGLRRLGLACLAQGRGIDATRKLDALLNV